MAQDGKGSFFFLIISFQMNRFKVLVVPQSVGLPESQTFFVLWFTSFFNVLAKQAFLMKNMFQILFLDI